MTLTKRISKGSSLTYTELDGNFTHLGGDGTYQFPSTDGTAGHVLTTNGSGALSFTNLSTTPLVFSVQNLSGPGAISLTDTVTFITTTGTDAYTLADGTDVWIHWLEHHSTATGNKDIIGSKYNKWQ